MVSRVKFCECAFENNQLNFEWCTSVNLLALHNLLIGRNHINQSVLADIFFENLSSCLIFPILGPNLDQKGCLLAKMIPTCIPFVMCFSSDPEHRLICLSYCSLRFIGRKGKMSSHMYVLQVEHQLYD